MDHESDALVLEATLVSCSKSTRLAVGLGVGLVQDLEQPMLASEVPTVVNS